MDEMALTRIQTRIARLERQNRLLLWLLCAIAAAASVAATHAAPNLVVADEVRAHRFTLVDPQGGVADDWHIDNPGAPNSSQKLGAPYSGWGYHTP